MLNVIPSIPHMYILYIIKTFDIYGWPVFLCDSNGLEVLVIFLSFEQLHDKIQVLILYQLDINTTLAHCILEDTTMVGIICDLLWRNREQVARQMFLIITCTLSYDQYRHYPMYSVKHNTTQHWWYAFMSDSFYNSQGKPWLLNGSSTASS